MSPPSHLLFVTGASSGIGRALAEAAPWPATRIVDISRRGGAGFEHFPADLADPASWPGVGELFEREIGAFGGERVLLVHSSGTLTPMGFAGEVDPAGYTAQVLLNSAALQVIGSAYLRALAGSPIPADLVNIGSGAASHPYVGWSAYCAGKAAADHWIRTAAAEQAQRDHPRRLVSIAPGVVATAMQAEIRGMSEREFPAVERFVEMHESGALRDPAEVAREMWALLDGLESGAVVDLRT